MSREKELWRGKARWTGEASSGDDYEMYNRKPMFRYNSYFGIHTVHYLDLVEFSGKAVALHGRCRRRLPGDRARQAARRGQRSPRRS